MDLFIKNDRRHIIQGTQPTKDSRARNSDQHDASICQTCLSHFYLAFCYLNTRGPNSSSSSKLSSPDPRVSLNQTQHITTNGYCLPAFYTTNKVIILYRCSNIVTIPTHRLLLIYLTSLHSTITQPTSTSLQTTKTFWLPRPTTAAAINKQQNGRQGAPTTCEPLLHILLQGSRFRHP